jgi:aspartate/methionine/tyrosine aminotransferase
MQLHRDLLVEGFRSAGFKLFTPEGGWFLLADSTGFSMSATELADELVTQAKVLIAPGTPFFSNKAEGERWVRATFARGLPVTTAALNKIQDYTRSRPLTAGYAEAAGSVPAVDKF